MAPADAAADSGTAAAADAAADAADAADATDAEAVGATDAATDANAADLAAGTTTKAHPGSSHHHHRRRAGAVPGAVSGAEMARHTDPASTSATPGVEAYRGAVMGVEAYRGAVMGVEAFVGGDPRRPILNGALLLAAGGRYEGRGEPLLWNALAEFTKTYRPDLWGFNGPELLTRVWLRCAGGAPDARANRTAVGRDVRVLPPPAFYPIHWSDAPVYASAREPKRQERMWRRIRKHSYAVHLWSRKTAGLPVRPGSLYHRLLSAFTVLPDDAHDDAHAGANEEAHDEDARGD